MAEAMALFQTALTDFSSYCGVVKQGAAKWIVSFTVLTDTGNFRLVIQITDAQTTLWESRLTALDLQAHQSDLGLEHVDWQMYFRLLKSALQEKRLAIRPEPDSLLLEIEYPLAQAKLKGSLRIRKTVEDPREIMGFMLGCLERALVPAENLKRERPPSPELAAAPKLPAAKPPAKKHKKIKEFGSKII